MSGSRKTALDTLDRCFGEQAWASQVLKKADSSDAAFATLLTLGVIQNYRMLDLCIDRYTSRLELHVRNILRLGTYELKYLDKPAYAVINEYVDLSRKSTKGLINAVLRRISASEMPDTESISVKYSMPDWLAERMIRDHGSEFTEAFFEASNREPEICWREAFKGRYVQDEAAYQSVLMAAPQSGMKVLDCCAAPGGKSYTAAVLMNNTGEITASDIHEKKLALIDGEKLGIGIIRKICADASTYDYADEYDLVIADVPCSGFGVIRKKPEIRFKEDISGLPQIQKKILENVSRFVKRDGKILYSTCTVFREENQDVAHGLEGFKVFEERNFYPNTDGTDGFYAAVLVRI